MYIDEHLLAGYISGELTSFDRSRVTRELISNPELRQSLHMAVEALAAARSAHSDNPLLRAMPGMEPSRPGQLRQDRQAIASSTRMRHTG
ncbi:MAG: hypothetical protein COV99_10615 [Bacteroidetes bacterium CG12_big_fil_rev_8_21_14_0_65_60_17]|nr:MAG: hypothetical protein COV99_10615 [Bacteroidetes bacterium CG12_big_fil_rev_8_21_14_0_65_60_17]